MSRSKDDRGEVWANRQPVDQFHPGMSSEDVPDDHPDIVAFRHRNDNKVQVDLRAELDNLKTRISELEQKSEPLK